MQLSSSRTDPRGLGVVHPPTDGLISTNLEVGVREKNLAHVAREAAAESHGTISLGSNTHDVGHCI